MSRLIGRLPVFVYGTLRPEAARGPAAARLMRQGRVLGPARFRGRLYRVQWYPGAVASEAEEWVVGDLIALPAQGDLLARLDAFERYDPRAPHRGEFRRGAWEVEGPEGPMPAWVYTYHGPVWSGARIWSGDFLD